MITFFTVLLPQNETLATPLANAQLIYMNKFLCIWTLPLPYALTQIHHEIIESLINANGQKSLIENQGCQVQGNFIAKLFTKTSQKVVTKSSQKTAQKLLHELQTAILSTQKRNSLVKL